MNEYFIQKSLQGIMTTINPIMETLIKDTIQIMQELGIDIRPSYQNDGEIQLKAWDQIQGFNAQFRIHSDIKGVRNPDSPDQMYYKDPIILTGHELKPILATTNNSKENVKARSIIAHELTHWLQKGTLKELHTKDGYIEFNGKNYFEYISQKLEMEAHAVQAFYFLKEFDKNKLNEIKSKSNSSDELRKNIINEFMIQNGKLAIFN